MTKIFQFIKARPEISLVFGFQIFRLILLPFFGLMPQDAYYHFYGENLALSYFDHPGMIGYILRLFTELLGKSVFAIKFADFTITSLTLLSFYYLASLFLSKIKLKYATVLVVSTILISILSFNSTPDVPLLFFWTLSLIFLYKAIFEGKDLFWILAGISMGLALDSKYTAIFLHIGLLAFLSFSNKYRKLFFSPWFWTSILISILVFSPVLYWNSQNEFVSFTFQTSERTGKISIFNFSLEHFFGTVLLQMTVLLPVLFYIIFLITLKYSKKVIFHFKLPSNKTLFLLVFFIPTFVGFLIISPFYWVKINWMMPAYISGIILASMFISRKLLKAQVIFSVVFHVLIAIEILFYIVPIKSNDTWYGWNKLAVEIKNVQKIYPDTFVFSCDNYKTSAALNFYMNENIYAQNVVGLPALQFDYVGQDLSKLNQKNAIFIDSDTRFKNRNKKGSKPSFLLNYFDEVTELDPIIIKNGNREVRKFWVYYCTDYQFYKILNKKNNSKP